MKKLGLILCAASALFGQENCLRGTPSHASARYRGPEGVGYGHGYTTLEGFLSPNWQRGFQPFLDVRGHMFDSGRTAANVGMGGRFNVFGNWAAGANLFYDFRDAKRLRVHQLGPGLELLSPFIDFRLNGYFPIANAKKLEDLTFDRFTGVGNQLIATRQFTAAPANVAFEVGAPLGPFLDPYLSVGPYYLFRRSVDNVGCAGVWGGLARLGLQVFDGISIGGEISYDKEYKTRGNGFVSLSYPLGPNTIRRHGSKWSQWYASPECNDRAVLQRVMTKDVVRQEIVPICSKRAQFMLDFSCIFADGNAPAGGDGSFEFPLNDLNAAIAQAGAGGCVYLLGGTFTGNFNPDGVPLLGSACDQVVPTVQGANIALPPLTPGVYPVLENPGAVIIGGILPGQGNANLFVRGIEFGASNIDVGNIVPAQNYNFTCNRHTTSGDYFLGGNIDNFFIDDNEFFAVTSGLTSTYINLTDIETFIMTNNSMVATSGGAGDIIDLNGTGDRIVISNNIFSTGPSPSIRDIQVDTTYSELVFDNNVLEGDTSPVMTFTSLNTLTATTTVTNNTINSVSPGPGTTFEFGNGVGTDIVIFRNNTSAADEIIDISTSVPGASLCLSFTGNTAGTFDITADPGATMNISESLGTVTSQNSGTLNFTGNVVFDTNCTTLP